MPRLDIQSVPAFSSLYGDYLRDSQLGEYVDRVPKWAWVGGSLLGAAVCFYIHYDRVYGVWRKQGVPGPTPLPIFGTTLMSIFAPNFHAVNTTLFQKYGQKGYVG